MKKKQAEFLAFGKNEIINDTKTLLYKYNPNIFDVLDFENDKIYQEPLLIAYFKDNEVAKTNIDTIIYGYTEFKLRPKTLKVKTDEHGRIYLPNMGWIITQMADTIFELIKNKEGVKFKLSYKGTLVNFIFEPLKIIKNSNIELLHYSIPVLKQFYFDSNSNLLDVDIENISKKHVDNVTIALNLIKVHVPSIYKALSEVTNRFCVFYIEPSKSGGVRRNSFSVGILSIGFFNAYQKGYNEIFFIDDIAHQTGHLVFHALTYNINNFIKIDSTTELQKFSKDTRTILIVFHALYTYYTTLTCLDAILDANILEKDKEHEALGRLLFYIEKCYSDIQLIEKDNDYSNDLEELFTEDGLEIYFQIKNTFDLIFKKWYSKLKNLDTSNQPYNFSYSKFNELNPNN
jgi:hypothetical protein